MHWHLWEDFNLKDRLSEQRLKSQKQCHVSVESKLNCLFDIYVDRHRSVCSISSPGILVWSQNFCTRWQSCTRITSILTFCQSNLFINTVMIIVHTRVNQIFSSFFFHRFKMPGYQRETPPPVVEEDGGTVQVNIFIIVIVNYQNCRPIIFHYLLR